jgi:hypothetical protein
MGSDFRMSETFASYPLVYDRVHVPRLPAARAGHWTDTTAEIDEQGPPDATRTSVGPNIIRKYLSTLDGRSMQGDVNPPTWS